MSRITTKEKQEVFEQLKLAGFQRNTGDKHDFGQAMRALTHDQIIAHDKYERLVKIVTEYLGV